MDRPDIQFAVKEVCRAMSRPCESDWTALKRLAMYLCGRPRLVQLFAWQPKDNRLNGYSDANWAGCKATRKSTSGGALCWGYHCVKSWSKTQATVALSSAESELTAAVKTASEMIGMIGMARDMGLKVEGDIWVEASAAMGIVNRQGCGKIRHLDTRLLWVQQKKLREEINFGKINGKGESVRSHDERLGRGQPDEDGAKVGMQLQRRES